MSYQITQKTDLKLSSTNTQLSLVKVTGASRQIATLYRLLSARVHRISHLRIPTRDEHYAFVRSHPYRAWYLIKLANRYIGTVYFTELNNIGIFVIPSAQQHLKKAIKLALHKHKPLSGIKSVRTNFFDFNVAPGDLALSEALEALGARCVQMTYSIMRQTDAPA